jgi:hypothetical protein
MRLIEMVVALVLFAFLGGAIGFAVGGGSPEGAAAGALAAVALRLGFLTLRAMFRGRKHKVTATLLRVWSEVPLGAPNHHHAYALFDAKGKRLKLKLKPRQFEGMSRDWAGGDVGHLTYAGKTLMRWKRASHDAPLRKSTGVKVFISYAHAEAETAAYIAQTMRAHGLNVWLDTAELRTGSKLRKELVRVIRASNYFMPLLSGKYFASTWCMKEFELAAKSRIAFVPLKITDQNLAMPPHLEKIYHEALDEPVYLDVTRRDPTGRLKELAEQLLAGAAVRH